MGGEGGQIGDFEGEVGQVWADDDGTAGWERANFQQFLTAWGFQKDEFRAAWRLVAADFTQAEDFGVEGDGFFQIGDAVAGVEQFGDHGDWGRAAVWGGGPNVVPWGGGGGGVAGGMGGEVATKAGIGDRGNEIAARLRAKFTGARCEWRN